jgi:MFS family permease
MFVDRWGRRKVLIIGAIGMGVSQLIVGTLYAIYKNSRSSRPNAGWAAAVFIWIYISNPLLASDTSIGSCRQKCSLQEYEPRLWECQSQRIG